MDKDDIDHALHGIRIMMQVAIDAMLTMEKSKAPKRANTTVQAIGLNNFPSTRCKVKIGK